MQFESTAASIEKPAQAMDKANERLLKGPKIKAYGKGHRQGDGEAATGKANCGGPREDRWGADGWEASNEQASTEPPSPKRARSSKSRRR